jgi:hypothetical protein
MRLKAIWVLVSVLVLGAAVAGCGDSSPALFDVAAARRGIGDQLVTSYPGLVIGAVRCPKQVVDKPTRGFNCTTSVGGAPVPVRVTIAKKHKYSFDTTGLIVTKQQAEQAVAARTTLPPTAVDCGPSPVQVLAVGGTIACMATLSDGSKVAPVVRVVDEAGHLSIENAQ